MATDPNVSASTETTETGASQTPQIDETVVKTHPAYQALEAEKNAVVQELNTQKGRLKAEKSKKADDDTSAKATFDEEEFDFRLQHADELKVYGPAYKELRSKGLSREDALEFASLKHKKTNPAEAERQAANSAPTPVAHRDTKKARVVTESMRKIPGFKPEWLDEFGDELEGQRM